MISSYPVKSIGEVLTLEYGKPLPEEDRTTGLGIPAYGANGILCWSKKAYRTEPSIIVGRKGSAGEVNLTDGPFWPTDVTYFVEHDVEATNLKYLFYLLTFLRIPKLAKGVKPGINRNDVYALRAPVPPIDEQRLIVTILDEAFDSIAKVAGNVTRALNCASELARSIVDAKLRVADASPTMELDMLRDGRRVITYGVIKLGDHIDDGIPCLRTSNVRWLRVDLEGMKRIRPDLSQEYRRTILQGGEVLVNVRGTLGGVAVASTEMRGWNISREVAMVPTDVTRTYPPYLAYWIARTESQAWLTRVLTGATYTGINIEDLRTLPVSVPALDEQRRIAHEIGGALTWATALSQSYERKLGELAKLKQSLLHSAFSGKLTSAGDIAA